MRMVICLKISIIFWTDGRITFLKSSYFEVQSAIKAKAALLHATEVHGERGYSSYSFLTSELDGGEWSASCPSNALALGKGHPVPIVWEAGLALEPVWTHRLEEKSFRLCRGSDLDRPVIQPVARHCTDWATRLTQITIEKYTKNK
jgi:hypothetical protein